MKTKTGVVLTGLKEEMQIANCVADAVWRMFGQELVITEGIATDGHMPNSKHYNGEACDYRTRYFPTTTVPVLVDTLTVCLGPDYDVVAEPTHIHVEYDPD